MEKKDHDHDSDVRMDEGEESLNFDLDAISLEDLEEEGSDSEQDGDIIDLLELVEKGETDGEAREQAGQDEILSKEAGAGETSEAEPPIEGLFGVDTSADEDLELSDVTLDSDEAFLQGADDALEGSRASDFEKVLEEEESDFTLDLTDILNEEARIEPAAPVGSGAFPAQEHDSADWEVIREEGTISAGQGIHPEQTTVQAGEAGPPQVAGISEERIEAIVTRVVQERIEKVVRETMAEVAERVIREAIDSLKQTLESGSD